MKYWEDTYGKRSNEFIEGVIAGVMAFAVWKDGKLVVGVQEKELKNEIESIKTELGYTEEKDKEEKEHVNT